MFRFRTVLVIFSAAMLCTVAHAAAPGAERFQSGSDKNAQVIKVGVALLKNTATRSVPLNVERDRLVSAINRMKPPKHSKDSARILAVALDSYSPDAANAQARDLGCDYVVFTDLTELRESGDPAPIPRPGEIRIGHDPVANDPTVNIRQETQRYAVMQFQLFRVNDATPRFDTSASVHEPTTEDGIVSMLMDRVANRVVSEIRSGNPQPPMQ